VELGAGQIPDSQDELGGKVAGGRLPVGSGLLCAPLAVSQCDVEAPSVDDADSCVGTDDP